MLLGIADARGIGIAAEAILAAVESRLGAPIASFVKGRSTIAVWSGALPWISRHDVGFAAEGWPEWSPPLGQDSADVWKQILGNARGDFACLVATHDGLLVGGGRAGGYRPSYVSFADGLAIVSTSMSALLWALPQSPALDVESLGSFATALPSYSSPSETPYLGVQRVPIAEAWVLRGAETPRRMSVARPVDTGRVQERAAAEALRSAVRSAVTRVMLGTRSVGVLVSGGVDSSAILAAACEVARESPLPTAMHAFSFDFDTPDSGDDRPYRRALLRHFGINAEHVTPQDAAPLARSSMVLDAMPSYALTGAFLVEAGRRARRTGAEFLLTGIGGDCVVDGCPELLGAVARRGKLVTALVRAARLRGPSVGGAIWRMRHLVLQPLVAPIIPGRWRRTRQRRALERVYPWAGPTLRRWLRNRVEAPLAPRPSLDSSPLEWYRALAQTPFLAQVGVSRAQHEFASGCTNRDPFFDDDFIATVATIPPLALLHGGWRRGLLRHVMQGMVPDDVRFRPNKAYLDSAVAGMVECAGGFAAFSDLAEVRMLADLGLAEPREFRRTFDRLAADPNAPMWWSVWPALATEAFLRQYESGSWG